MNCRVFERKRGTETGEAEKKENLTNENGDNSGVQKEEKEGQRKEKQEKHLALAENKKATTTQIQIKGKEKEGNCEDANEEKQVKTQHRFKTTLGHYTPDNKRQIKHPLRTEQTRERRRIRVSKRRCPRKKSKVVFKPTQFQKKNQTRY